LNENQYIAAEIVYCENVSIVIASVSKTKTESLY